MQKISDGLHHLGPVRPFLSLSLLFAWTVVFLCIMKGIKTSGKVRVCMCVCMCVCEAILSLSLHGIETPQGA